MARKLVIFDFDGTLADTLPFFLSAFDEAAGKYGFARLDRARQAELRGFDAHQIMSHHRIPFWRVPAIASFMRQRTEDHAGGIALFPGVPEALRELARRRVALAIVTSNSKANVVRVLGQDCAALFGQMECGASLFGKVPKIRKVLARTGIAAADAILVGDEIRDARAAAEAGLDFGAVAWGFNHLDALLALRPREVFTQAAELPLKLAAPT